MRIECEIGLVGLCPTIIFEDGVVWRIPITEWESLMNIILPPSVRDRYYQTDYTGEISLKRYIDAKEYYKQICERFRIEERNER